jgi:hypothetical protein
VGYLYFDESIHVRAGFILGAFVHSASDMSPVVADILRECGLAPPEDEFKSRSRMDGNRTMQIVRTRLLQLARGTKVGIAVIPVAERPRLDVHALRALAALDHRNDRLSNSRHDVFFDAGIFRSTKNAYELRDQLKIGLQYNLHVEQDSRRVAGLQLADCIAHRAATMLLAQLGLVRKTVRVGDGSDSDPERDVPLSFEVWHSLRSSFFHKNLEVGEDGTKPPHGVVDTSVALYIAEDTPAPLAEASHRSFDRMYVACTR